MTPTKVAINTDGVTANKLKVVASGTTMTFYINDVAVATLTGQTQFLTGKFGVAMVRTSASASDVVKVSYAKLAPSSFALPKAEEGVVDEAVSPEQEAANAEANRRQRQANPLFDGGRPVEHGMCRPRGEASR